MSYIDMLYKLHILEAVIDPNESLDTIELSQKFERLLHREPEELSLLPNSLLNKEFAKYDIHFWTYGEFVKNAEPEDLKFVPGRIFAYANPKTGAIAFVGHVPGRDAFRNVIRHELVHRGQVERMNKVGGKPTPITDPESYMNNPQEIMAYALSVYDQLRGRLPAKRIIQSLKTRNGLPEVSSHLSRLKPDNKRMFIKYLVGYAQQDLAKENPAGF